MQRDTRIACCVTKNIGVDVDQVLVSDVDGLMNKTECIFRRDTLIFVGEVC